MGRDQFCKMGHALERSQKILIVFLVFFIFFPQNFVFAKKSIAFSVEKFMEDMASEASLKKIISHQYVNEAQILQEAFTDFSNEQFDSCLKHLEKIKGHSLFKDYATYLRAASYLKLSEFDEALARLPEIKNPQTQIEWDLYWLRLELMAETEQIEPLKKIVAELRKKYRKNRPIQIKSAYVLGLSYLQAKLTKAGLHEWLTVLVEEPGSEFDDKVLARLKKFNIKEDEILSEALANQRALKLIEKGYAYKAETLYQKLAKKFGGETRYKERLANALFRGRKYPEAIALYQDILAAKNHAQSELEIFVTLATAFGRIDDFEGAIAMHQKIINNYPGTQSARHSQNKMGFLYFDSQQYDPAITFYDKGLSTSHSERAQDQMHEFLFWSAYLTQKFEKAKTHLEARLKLQGRRKPRESELNYWMARTFDHLKQMTAAKEFYNKVIQKDPDDYYGLLAKQRLSYQNLQDQVLVNPKLIDFAPQTKKSDMDWSKKINGKVKEQRLILAILLYHMGEDVYSFAEAKAFLREYKDALDVSLMAAVLLGGDFHQGYAIRKMATEGGLPGCDVACGYAMAFPRAYEKYIKIYAERFKVEAELVFSVMRQESVFQPQALSWAYAYGLMQIIPPTGEEIAAKIKFKDFHPEFLNKPHVNTLFGTFYLSFLMNEFDQEIIYALAGYNAGPGAVSRWRKKYGNLEKDEFIELIPYGQTRDYVKKVLWNYWVYKRSSK